MDWALQIIADRVQRLWGQAPKPDPKFVLNPQDQVVEGRASFWYAKTAHWYMRFFIGMLKQGVGAHWYMRIFIGILKQGVGW